jgi:hypothetical protein
MQTWRSAQVRGFGACKTQLFSLRFLTFTDHLHSRNIFSMLPYKQGVLGFSRDGAYSMQVSESHVCASHRTKKQRGTFFHLAFFRVYFNFYFMSVREQVSSLATGTSSHTMRRARSTSPRRTQTWFAVGGTPTPRPCF